MVVDYDLVKRRGCVPFGARDVQQSECSRGNPWRGGMSWKGSWASALTQHGLLTGLSVPSLPSHLLGCWGRAGWFLWDQPRRSRGWVTKWSKAESSDCSLQLHWVQDILTFISPCNDNNINVFSGSNIKSLNWCPLKLMKSSWFIRHTAFQRDLGQVFYFFMFYPFLLCMEII